MTPRLFGLALIVHVLAWCGCAVQKLGAADPPAADVQDVVYLAPSGPVLIRLHVTVDGKPFRTAYQESWERYVKTLFALLDRDADGKLSKAEAERMPPPQMFFTAGLPGLGGSSINVAFNFGIVDADDSGSVSLKELGDYYREQSGTAFVSQTALRAARDPQNPAPLPQVNQNLFRRLDLDLDGRLSKKELDAAVKTLAALDYDEDELVTAQELSPSRPAGPVPPPTPGQPRVPATASFVPLYPESDSVPARYRNLVPQVEVKLNFSRTGERTPEVEVVGANPLKAAKTPAGSLAFTVDGAAVELLQNLGQPRRVPGGKDAYLNHLQEVDVNRDGKLTAGEAKPSPFFGKVFSLLDRDGDGAVTAKETDAYLDAVREEQFLALAARVNLLTAEPGRGLFDLLDRNNDGRLSQRELRELSTALASCDTDMDGAIKPEEIPVVHRVAVGLGQASFNRHGGNVVQVPPRLPGMESPDMVRGGPLWFRKMDRNADGEVSRSEFLGTAKDFATLDADGDRLIDAEEASAAKK